MDCDDVGMVERGDGPSLALEARLAAFGIERRGVRQHFERDETVEPRVPRFVDLAHSPAAERGDDVVRPETRACGERHSLGFGEDYSDYRDDPAARGTTSEIRCLINRSALCCAAG